MAKILRKFQKIFALTNDGSQRFGNGQFGSGQAGTKVITDDVEELQELAAFDAGWEDAVMVNSAGQPTLPPLPEMQALDYICTYQIAYILQEGMPEYNADTTYYENSIVKAPGTYILYGSLIDDNLGNSVSDPADWEMLVDLEKAVYTDNSLTVDNELTLWDGTGGRKTKRANGFTGYPVLTAGVLATNNAADTFNAIKQAATTSATGVVELATTAEVQAGVDTDRAITPSGLAGALGFTKYFDSGNISFSLNTNADVAHGLGTTPVIWIAYIKCTSVDDNWSVGDQIPVTNLQNDQNSGLIVGANATNMRYVIGSGTLDYLDRTAHTQAAVDPTKWVLVIRAWA